MHKNTKEHNHEKLVHLKDKNNFTIILGQYIYCYPIITLP